MTVSTLPPSALHGRSLLPAVEAAARVSREAHEATRALTDTVLACQRLPAEVYQYAPQLSQATLTLTAASRALTTVTGYATTNPTPDNVRALQRATAELAGAVAVLRSQTAALATAASWASGSNGLPAGGFGTPGTRQL